MGLTASSRRGFICGAAALCALPVLASATEAETSKTSVSSFENVTQDGISLEIASGYKKVTVKNGTGYVYQDVDAPYVLALITSAVDVPASNEGALVQALTDKLNATAAADADYDGIAVEESALQLGSLLGVAYSARRPLDCVQEKGVLVRCGSSDVLVRVRWEIDVDEPANLEGVFASVEPVDADATSIVASTDPEGERGIRWNEVVSTDNYEFAIEGSYWADEVYPPNTSSVYSYYSDNADSVYLVAYGSFTNLGGERVYDLNYSTDAEFLINGEYTMSAFVAGASSDGNDFYEDSPNPWETIRLYIVAEIPNALYEQTNTIQLRWSFTDDLTGSYDEDERVITYTASY